MKTRSITLALFIPLLFFFQECKKSDGLPSPTQNGNNIMACYVNGQPQVYKGTVTYMSPQGVSGGPYLFPDSTLAFQIFASNKKTDLQLFSYIKNPTLNTKYQIVNPYPYDESFYINNDDQNHPFIVDQTKSSLTFTRFDDSIFSGYFTFYGINDLGQTVNITDGFFDIKW